MPKYLKCYTCGATLSDKMPTCPQDWQGKHYWEVKYFPWVKEKIK